MVSPSSCVSNSCAVVYIVVCVCLPLIWASAGFCRQYWLVKPEDDDDAFNMFQHWDDNYLTCLYISGGTAVALVILGFILIPWICCCLCKKRQRIVIGGQEYATELV